MPSLRNLTSLCLLLLLLFSSEIYPLGISKVACAEEKHGQEVDRAEDLIDADKIADALQLYREILQKYQKRSPATRSEVELGKLHLRRGRSTGRRD